MERAFRTIKAVNPMLRLVHHRTADRVRSVRRLSILAWQVERHMRETWRTRPFSDIGREDDIRTR
ncbi:MAG: IS1634 family transposase, partial [Boseongicola sp. SB0662_bin_57]|nr:IS1634 family transposase [Boseongicola sp. SB0662_bin_57]